jgi:hypothetical protein
MGLPGFELGVNNKENINTRKPSTHEETKIFVGGI